MRVIAKSTLRRFWEQHPDTQSALESLYRILAAAEWTSPHDVKASDPSASIINADRICLNVRGNRLRVIIAVDYARRVVFIKFVGTHADYDHIHAATVEP